MEPAYDVWFAVASVLFSTPLSIVGLFYNHKHGAYEKLTNAEGSEEEVGIQADKSQWAGEEGSNQISRILFNYLNPVMKLGSKRPLEVNDMLPLPANLHTESNLNQFRVYWNLEKAKPKPSLTRALFKAFGWAWFRAGALKFIQDSLLFCGPLVLKQLLAWVADPTAPLWLGFTWVSCIFVSALLQNLFLQNYFHRTYATGMQVSCVNETGEN